MRVLIVLLLLTGCIQTRPDNIVRHWQPLYQRDERAYVQGCYQGLLRAALQSGVLDDFYAYSKWAGSFCMYLAYDVLGTPQNRSGQTISADCAFSEGDST